VFQAAGIRVIRSAVQAPRMNSIMERWMVLREHEDFYNSHRPHRALDPMPLSLFWLRRDAGICPGEGWVDEFDGGGGVVPGAVLAWLLDAVGVVACALDDTGIGALAAPVQVLRAGDAGVCTFERALLIRGEKPDHRSGGG
jgi:hypothetical protein